MTANEIMKSIKDNLNSVDQNLEQIQCDDCISRHKAIVAITACDGKSAQIEAIEKLPSVTPQPKTGHWIDIMVGEMPAQACDQCKTFYPLAYTGGGHRFCPNCGAKMIDPQERSGKE